MPLNVGVSSVELTEQLQLSVTASVYVVGFEPSVDYGGALSTSLVPEPDYQRVSGTVGPGAGDRIEAVLGTGLTESDLPETIGVTFAIDEGPAAGEQEQVEVELSMDDPGEVPGTPVPDPDPDPPGGVAEAVLLGAVALVLLIVLLRVS